MLLKPEEAADCLYLVEDGAVELYTTFEGNEFILERLYRGSALNFRAFFMDDLMYVYARCCKNSTILMLDKQTIESIKASHADFEKSMLSYQNNILKQNKIFPLDYIMNLPKELRDI